MAGSTVVMYGVGFPWQKLPPDDPWGTKQAPSLAPQPVVVACGDNARIEELEAEVAGVGGRVGRRVGGGGWWTMKSYDEWSQKFLLDIKLTQEQLRLTEREALLSVILARLYELEKREAEREEMKGCEL